MPNPITLIVAFATLGCFSIVTCAEPAYFESDSKGRSMPSSVCATKCDAKGEKCLVTCDDKQTGNKCKNGFYRVSPFGVLEVRPQQKSP